MRRVRTARNVRSHRQTASSIGSHNALPAGAHRDPAAGAIAPANESDFLYAPAGEFAGEAGKSSTPHLFLEGRSADAILSEFQRGGFLLTYVLDCPLEPNGTDTTTPQHLIHQRLPAVLALIRRSLQPKRIVPISSLLEPMLPEIAITGYPVVLDGTQPFALDGDGGSDRGSSGSWRRGHRLRLLRLASGSVEQRGLPRQPVRLC